ncbi:hypothetical protein [Paraburkholderia bannensis]|nr:hypothetical protein [Paraburkholderia bannensis]
MKGQLAAAMAAARFMLDFPGFFDAIFRAQGAGRFDPLQLHTVK